jgi:hypothetical protein
MAKLAAAPSSGLGRAGMFPLAIRGENRNEPATKEDVPYLSVKTRSLKKTDVVVE